MQSLAPDSWIADWLWGLPLIVIASVIHVIGLGAIELGMRRGIRRAGRAGGLMAFAVAVAATVLATTALHGVGAGVWAAAYLWLDALPDKRSAMLYSIGAMTTFGHESHNLAGRWQMLGALEALNGMLLFGLTTAFLYSTIRNIRIMMKAARPWPTGQGD